jgi:hypothetical protein
MIKKLVCRLYGGLLLFVLTGAFCSCYAAETNQPAGFTHTTSPTGFIKGHSWGWPGVRGEYLGDAAAESMRKLAKTNANWVCISFAGEMNKANEPNIVWADNEPCMVTDAEIRHAIELARKNNLKIILKPTVNVRDGNWRGFIDFRTADNKTNTGAWDKWWTDFREFLLHYAQIAEETKCEMLCLGCEMGTTERFVDRWRSVIADVRKVYSGAITYNANHGNEDKVRWWDAVDIIGMSGYYPVGANDVGPAPKDLSKVPPADTSVEAMKQRWAPIRQKLKYVSKRFDRPVFFIEVGVCSARGCSAAPWTHNDPNTMIYDGDEQARFYQAVMEMFWDEPWFFGFAWWDWPANPYSPEKAKTDTGFCIYNKPAEQVVRQWYAKPR